MEGDAGSATALGQGRTELCLVLWLHSERQHLGNMLFWWVE